MMLRHMNLDRYADTIEKAALGVRFESQERNSNLRRLVWQTIGEGKTVTGDLGGDCDDKGIY